jgi:hypothetical protein
MVKLTEVFRPDTLEEVRRFPTDFFKIDGLFLLCAKPLPRRAAVPNLLLLLLLPSL